MRCFVIMPFGDPAQNPEYARRQTQIYERWIKPAVESVQIPGQNTTVACHRADRELRPGDVVSHVIEQLVRADIVIADLSGKSPNVFYELGVRHAVSNDTILIAHDLDDIPFDLRNLRTITYRYEPEHMLDLREQLEAAVRMIVEQGSRIDNPVRDFLLREEVDRMSRASAPPGFAAVNELAAIVSELRSQVAEQANGMREFLNAITGVNQSTAVGVEQRAKNLEGVWATQDGSVWCFRVIRGEIRIAYAYVTFSILTSDAIDCRFVGEYLFGHFRWFIAPIEGSFYLQQTSANELRGAWWYKQRDDYATPPTLPEVDNNRLNSITWKLISRTTYPEWAQSYFAVIDEGMDPLEVFGRQTRDLDRSL